MLARLRKATKENEGGFTLIELLVVMIIIGILAAIAIPAFLSQKNKAKEASAKSDATHIAQDISAVLVDGDFVATTPLVLTSQVSILVKTLDTPAGTAVPMKLSSGNTVSLGSPAAAAPGTFCITVTTASLATWSAGDGGLKKGGTCP